MPLGMVVGAMFCRPIAALEAASDGMITPSLIFLMLFFTFCRVNVRNMRLQPLHLWLLTAQILFSMAVYAILLPFSQTVAQGGMICVLTPIAMAAVVIGGMLGADIVSMTTFSLLCNMTIALVAPVILTLTGNGDCSLAVILAKVAPLLILPFAAAQACRALTPKISGWVAAHSQISFYLWLVSHDDLYSGSPGGRRRRRNRIGRCCACHLSGAVRLRPLAGAPLRRCSRRRAIARTEEYGAGGMDGAVVSRSDLVGSPDSLYCLAELRELLPDLEKRPRNKSVNASFRPALRIFRHPNQAQPRSRATAGGIAGIRQNQ